MSEKIGFTPDLEREIINHGPECLLDCREEFLSVLESASPKEPVDIDHLRPEIAGTHKNRVFLVEVTPSDEGMPAIQKTNGIRYFQIQDGESRLLAVFKPKSGEHATHLREFGIGKNSSMYAREVAAYLVDYYLGLGIVPPTIMKEIGDDTGSLQLYVPHSLAEVPPRMPRYDRDAATSGLDWKKMAMLDRLIDNCDRNVHNYLVWKSDQTRVIGIDHGCSFCQTRKSDDTLALNYFRQNPSQAALTPELITSLDKLLASQEELLSRLPQDIIVRMNIMGPKIFESAQKMLEANSILV